MPSVTNVPQDRRSHWVRTNQALRYPRRVITLDAEAIVTPQRRSEQHRFRLAVATFDAIDRHTRAPAKSSRLQTTSTDELWAAVDAFTRTGERTVIFAHNLGYDLRITEALSKLPELGWEFKGGALDGNRCWMRWTRGRRGLTMVDTASWFPRPLSTIAKAIGMRKLPMPAMDDSDEKWFRYCRRDVEITRAAVLHLLDWLEGNEMGNFKLTGPAQAQSAYRHQFMPARALLAHNHVDTLEAERRSAYTGRAEVWRHGRAHGYLYEWDYQMAYAHLARKLLLPVRMVGYHPNPTADDVDRLERKYLCLHEVDVETEIPLVPTQHEERVLWPVGKFHSTLWDVEVRLLRMYEQPFTINKTILYRPAPLLKAWGEWIVEQLDERKPATDPLIQIMLKGWSRSLIGRFGLRYPNLELQAVHPDSMLHYAPSIDAVTGEVSAIVRIGHNEYWQTGVEEGSDSTPAVMAYIMAAARVQLWATMQFAGPERVYYVDTDSIIVDAAGHKHLLEYQSHATIDGLRFKRRLRDVELIAPRMLAIDGTAKIAGLSKDATRTGRRTWRAPAWESVTQSIGHGRADGVTVFERNFEIKTEDVRRRHRPHGETLPYRIDTVDGIGS